MTIYSMGKGNPDLSSSALTRPGSLYAMAEDLMGRVVNAAFDLGIELPGRRVIYPSPVPVDCAQVSVLMVGWAPTVLWDGYVACQTFKWAGTFQVIITRATPAVSASRDGKAAPLADNMRKAGRMASDDSDVLVRLVQGLGEIGPEMTLLLGAPEGGFQSVELTITIPEFGGLI